MAFPTSPVSADAALLMTAHVVPAFAGGGLGRMLIQGVARDPNTLGYVSLAYYSAHRQALKAVPIAAKAGATPVEPTVENIAKVIYELLKPKLSGDRAKLASVTVWETPKTWCEYSEGSGSV